MVDLHPLATPTIVDVVSPGRFADDHRPGVMSFALPDHHRLGGVSVPQGARQGNPVRAVPVMPAARPVVMTAPKDNQPRTVVIVVVAIVRTHVGHPRDMAIDRPPVVVAKRDPFARRARENQPCKRDYPNSFLQHLIASQILSTGKEDLCPTALAKMIFALPLWQRGSWPGELTDHLEIDTHPRSTLAEPTAPGAQSGSLPFLQLYKTPGHLGQPTGFNTSQNASSRSQSMFRRPAEICGPRAGRPQRENHGGRPLTVRRRANRIFALSGLVEFPRPCCP